MHACMWRGLNRSLKNYLMLALLRIVLCPGHKPSGPDVGLRYIGRSSARMLCALDFNRGEFDGIVTELESVDSMFGTKAPTCAAGGDWQCHPS